MFEIGLQQYNEMVRYEPAMDELRALAAWLVAQDGERFLMDPGSVDYLFRLIKHYARAFAEDIENHLRVQPETVDLLFNGIRTVRLSLGINDADIEAAREDQIFKGAGFWEMRRFLGQFDDLVEAIAAGGYQQLICAGISGCVVGEYLGAKLEKLGQSIAVEHMVFRREKTIPVVGLMRPDFRLPGEKLLLVEDCVVEARTIRVVLETLRGISPELTCSLFAIELDSTPAVRAALGQFHHVYTFEE